MRPFTPTDRRWLRPRVLVAAATATAAVIAVTVVSTLQASAAVGTTVVGVASGRCLDVIGNSQVSKTGVNIYDCNGQANQGWTFTPAGEFKVYDAGLCLDVAGNVTTAPARVQIHPCTGGANQRWRINADGSIAGVQSGLCLDVTGEGTANSTLVGLFTCTGRGNQRWTTSAGSADAQPPGIPGNPRVSNLSCDAVTFGWDAAADNVGVVFYDVYHDGQLMKSVSGSTLTTDLIVVGGVTWGLYVNARDAVGNVSQASVTVPIKPPQCQVDTQAPSVPAGLVGAVSGTTVTLSWVASSDNIGVRGYDVYRGGVKVGSVTGTATTAPATAFIDSALVASTRYAYHVVARDAQSNVSAPSSTVTVTTGVGCDAVCTVKQVGADTDIPWGLAALADGTILYNRRDAHDIIRLNPVTGVKTTVGTVPNVENTDGEGGLTGLAISPTFASDGWLYIMHTSPADNRIVRIRLVNDRLDLGSEQVLVSGILRNKFHDGGRLRFGPDGKLYATTGDAQNTNTPQDRGSLNSKVLRLNPDGSVPADNPFGNYVWSYGHRNPQGLAFDAQGRLWEQEFGNGVMDETNLIVKGGNYGWPACEGTSGTCGTAGFLAPKKTYPTADGSCAGIAVVRDVLYVACERGERLNRIPISGESLGTVRAFFTGTYGRIRTVELALDGGLWMTTSNGGDKDSTPNNTDAKIFHVVLGG